MRRVLIALLALLLAVPCIALAKVHAVSTDGEATVYLTDDFSKNFELTYAVAYPPAPRNRSWSDVSLLLLGRTPGGSISIGLTRGSPNQRKLSALAIVIRAGGNPVQKMFPVTCNETCTLTLNGDDQNITVAVNGKIVALVPRAALALTRPYVQINGEVSAVGDTIYATLKPLRTTLARKPIAATTCAFTTQGVSASALPGGGLRFSGKRDPNADAAFVSLIDGSMGNSCPHKHASR